MKKLFAFFILAITSASLLHADYYYGNSNQGGCASGRCQAQGQSQPTNQGGTTYYYPQGQTQQNQPSYTYNAPNYQPQYPYGYQQSQSGFQRQSNPAPGHN